jgi:hypothetical protein
MVSRFPSVEPLSALAATAVTSAMASTSGMMMLELWAGTLETMRVGTTHMSYRAGRAPWGHHRAELFVGGVAIFLLIAIFHYLATLRLVERTPTT